MTTQAVPGPFGPLARRRVPAHPVDACRSRPGRGERQLLSVGSALARACATDRALYHRETAEAWTRVGWEWVDRADWDPRRGLLIVVGLGPGGPWRAELPLPDGAALVPLARERIRWTTLLTSTLRLDDLGDVRVMARRQPGTGALLWLVRLPATVDRDDPRVPARVDAVIAELRALAGI